MRDIVNVSINVQGSSGSIAYGSSIYADNDSLDDGFIISQDGFLIEDYKLFYDGELHE